MHINPTLIHLPLLAILVGACASHPSPVALSKGTNPTTAVIELERDIAQAESEEQISVLARKDYDGAQKYLSKAQEEKERDEVLENVGIARGFLRQARQHAKANLKPMGDVTDSRSLAVKAGAERYDAEALKDIDDDLIDLTEEGSNELRQLSNEDKAEFQKRYMDLELAAIQATALGDARSHIEDAKKNDAEDLSPASLKKAEAAYQTAMMAIAADRHNETAVEAAAAKATETARQLAIVTETAKGAKGRSPEQIAIEIEGRRARNAKLSGELKVVTGTVGSIDRANQTLNQENEVLEEEKQRLAGAIEVQKAQEAAIAKAEQSFKNNEAEVTRQGDKIIIRLKALQFQTGSANLPKESVVLLGKVRDVVAEFNPSRVLIEGHTDSTGSAATNMKLSQERADAVADYMVSTKVLEEAAIDAQGFGPQRPLSPNNTANGRATNRRVDLILEPQLGTPSTAAPAGAG